MGIGALFKDTVADFVENYVHKRDDRFLSDESVVRRVRDNPYIGNFIKSNNNKQQQLNNLQQRQQKQQQQKQQQQKTTKQQQLLRYKFSNSFRNTGCSENVVELAGGLHHGGTFRFSTVLETKKHNPPNLLHP